MTLSNRRYSLFPVGLIWIGVVASAIMAGWLNGLSWDTMWPFGAVAMAPAVLGIILTPFIDREWAQIIVIFGWLALAVVSVLAVSFVPMAILFMCAPAAAALFEREKVVEAMVLAAIIAATLFYAAQQGFVPDSLTEGASKDWGQKMGIFATLAFLIGTLMTTAHRNEPQELSTQGSPLINQATLDAFPGKFFLLDKRGKLVSLNQRASEAFDFTDNKGSDLSSILGLNETAADEVKGLLRSVRKTGQDIEVNILASIVGDDEALYRVSAGRAAGGQLGVSIQGVSMQGVKDSEDQRSAQNNIVELAAQRDKIKQDSDEKTLFFAGVSHELRTPLNAIIGFSDMMRSRLFGPLPSKYAEYADMIHDSGQHMLDLIGDVLDLSKIEAGKHSLKYDTFQVEDIIRSSMKMVRPSADAAEVALELKIDDTQDIILEADRRAVRQILLNLLSNSIKFSPKGSAITVSSQLIDDKIRILVTDQGEGMSPDMIAKIGQPYLDGENDKLAQARGTGLGLSLVKSLVDLHNGDLKVDSTLGEGARIAVDLPLLRPTA